VLDISFKLNAYSTVRFRVLTLVVKRGKRRGTSICRRSTEKGIYLTIQVTPDIASTFFSKKEWKAKNSTKLSPRKSVDNKK